MDERDVSPDPMMLGKVQVIALAIAIQAGGAMPTLEEIGEADLALGAPRWAKRGHPAWVKHLYQKGLAKNNRITLEGKAALHWALRKREMVAPLAEWVRKTIGDDDV